MPAFRAQENNIGSVGNCNFLLSLSDTEYFMWLADDDEILSIAKKYGWKPRTNFKKAIKETYDDLVNNFQRIRN